MQERTLVSVILPTYNRAALLERSINSVLIQTHPFWELIIWDDGSTDDTADLINSYKDERLRYFCDENHGVAYARNRAIEAARGEFVTFLDSDDEWADEKLASQVKAMSFHPQIDVLFSDFMNINMETNARKRTFEEYGHALKLLKVEKLDDESFVVSAGLLEGLTVENFIATDSVMIRHELLKSIGMFTEELRNSEDFELWWRLALADACFAYVNKIHLTRYKSLGNLSSSNILTCENYIKGLDFCARDALSAKRGDLIPLLNVYYRNAWQNLIRLYGNNGNVKGMLSAFFQSIKYGFNLGSFRLLFETILSGKP